MLIFYSMKNFWLKLKQWEKNEQEIHNHQDTLLGIFLSSGLVILLYLTVFWLVIGLATGIL